ncbi:MAG TPA: hypothetical protein VHO67_00635 [Polyangia bacterium]|nr:hypothetical protein [Polyangia bacterium]
MRAWPILLTTIVAAAGCHTGQDGSSGTGGARDGTGGAAAAGGSSPPASGGNGVGTGGHVSTGGTAGGAGALGSGGAAGGGAAGGPAGYALNPPRQCDNQFFVSGCQKGVASSPCSGVCSAANACEDVTQKPGADVGFLCPRFTLQSAEMTQAAADDFGPSPPFDYAVAGHDVDTGGLDASAKTTCCQCYQLVYALPENEARVNGNGASAIAIPRPLIVQAFNTAAGGGQNFDVFMGAGGFGAFNACDPAFTQLKSQSGQYLYTSFPEQGEANAGGVNAATQLAGCKNAQNLVTADTLASTTCTASVQSACNQFASSTLAPQALSDSIHSCLASNDPANYRHINWQVYAKKIECPAHLTQVTGCKLAPQGLPAADPNVTTPAQAAQDASFRGNYTTTTMQDCCKPTCAWQDAVTGSNGGLSAVGKYNSFYTCDKTGTPVTE